MTPSCPQCGSPNKPGNGFCNRCGARLPAQRKGLPVEAILGLVFVALVAVSLVAAVMLAPPGGGTSGGGRPSALASSSPSAKPTPSAPPTPAYYLSEAKKYLARDPSEYSLNQAFGLLRGVPAGAPEFKEAQRLIRETEPRLAQMKRESERRAAQEKERVAPELRERLKGDYRDFVAGNNPHLNYIDAKLTKAKGGYALWATHEFFTQYTFSAGDDAPQVSAWIDRNREALGQAGIVRVGVMGRGPYASWSYFDLR
jgi:hypothetical protein